MAELDPTIAAWVEVIKAADTQIAYYTGIRGRAIEHVKDAMGDTEQATINGLPAVSWAWSKPAQRLDRSKLEADFGADVIAGYLVDNKPARPFRLLLEEDAG
jgi:hypothetical protein